MDDDDHQKIGAVGANSGEVAYGPLPIDPEWYTAAYKSYPGRIIPESP